MKTLYRFILWTSAISVAVLVAGIVSYVATRPQRGTVTPAEAPASEQADLQAPSPWRVKP